MFAVWFNALPGDSRDGWSSGLLHDPRVVHLWDAEQALGLWLGGHPDFREHGLLGAGVLMWDTYLLFGPEARWGEDGPAPLAGSGHTIVRKREQLREQLEALLAAVPLEAAS